VVSGVMIYPCAGARERSAKRALVRALAGGGRRLIQSLRVDPHAADRTCWLHGEGYCLSINPPLVGDRALLAEGRAPGPTAPTTLSGRVCAGEVARPASWNGDKRTTWPHNVGVSLKQLPIECRSW
jgi:hypothetical protein